MSGWEILLEDYQGVEGRASCEILKEWERGLAVRFLGSGEGVLLGDAD